MKRLTKFGLFRLAAIYTNDLDQQGFLCSGTLVSLKVVATAAHCLHGKHERKLKADGLTVFVGKNSLEELKEPGSVRSSVAQIEIHPDWNAINENLDADIAVAVLSTTMTSSKFIKPICLWFSTKSFEDLISTNGVVVGWGVTSRESQVNSFEQPTWTRVKVATQDACSQSSLNYWATASKRTFCAGDEDGVTGPCQGDYGKIKVDFFC